MPARAPASMLMLQMVMRPSIESARMAEPAYSITQPVAPSVPILPMMARMMSFAVTPRGQFAFDGDAEGLRLRLRQRLRGQHVLHFAGADAESQRAERAVGGGVRVAADDGHAGLGDARARARSRGRCLARGCSRRRARRRSRRSSCAAWQSAWPRSGRRCCSRPSMVVGTL